jgi:hypothetical protein
MKKHRHSRAGGNPGIRAANPHPGPLPRGEGIKPKKHYQKSELLKQVFWNKTPKTP